MRSYSRARRSAHGGKFDLPEGPALVPRARAFTDFALPTEEQFAVLQRASPRTDDQGGSVGVSNLLKHLIFGDQPD